MSFRMDHSCVREEEEDSVLHQGMLYLLEMDLHFFFSDENLPDEAYFSLDQCGLTSGSILENRCQMIDMDLMFLLIYSYQRILYLLLPSVS